METGTLSYFDKPGGTLKKAIRAKDIISCTSGAESEKKNMKQTSSTGTSDYPFIFEIVTNYRPFFLYAASQSERSKWVTNLHKIIDDSSRRAIEI